MPKSITFLVTTIIALGCILPQCSSCLAETAIDNSTKVEEALELVNGVVEAGPYAATWKSLEEYEIPEWYLDAKFGIFIHWGVYSVPAYGNEWYPRRMYIDSGTGDKKSPFNHHIETWGPQSKFGYKDFVPLFKAERFDPAEWAKLFEDSGARYVVPVAEHHDGFPMYDCSFTPWNAAEMGPKRDVVKELATEVRSRGLKFGVSSHRAFNWAYFVRRDDFDTADPECESLYGKSYPWLATEDAKDHRSPWPPMDEDFKNDWLARTAELVQEYDPDLVWFDFGIAQDRSKSHAENPFADYLQRFAAYYYNHALQRGGSAIINYKWNAFPESAAVLDLERSKMDEIRHPFWQTDTAVSSSSWGYTENQKYKTVDRLIDDLVDIVSKNGCLLLNVGPRSDGTIPEEDQRILREIGQWLAVNGEAIYGTRPWKTYGEGPTGTATGHLSESKNKPFTAKDFRFTKKGNALYAIGLAWPTEPIEIASLARSTDKLGDEIAKVTLLGSDATIDWKHTATSLTIDLSSVAPQPNAYVLKVMTK
ncbi:MAG: alpha-L-fucosidase [Planctomycetota bacterium]